MRLTEANHRVSVSCCKKLNSDQSTWLLVCTLFKTYNSFFVEVQVSSNTAFRLCLCSGGEKICVTEEPVISHKTLSLLYKRVHLFPERPELSLKHMWFQRNPLLYLQHCAGCEMLPANTWLSNLKTPSQFKCMQPFSNWTTNNTH